MVSIRYDRYSEHKRTAQIKACYNMGVVGIPLPDGIHQAKVNHVQVLLALSTSNSVFLGDGKAASGARREFAGHMQEALLDRMDQERKWIEHYNACLKAHKDGTKKKEACLKAVDENAEKKGIDTSEFSLPALLALANVFNAGINASLASGLEAGELKEDTKPTAAKPEPASEPERKQQGNNDSGGKKSLHDTIAEGNRKVTKEMYKKAQQERRKETGRAY